MSKKAKPQDIKALRGIGHQLSPIVTIGGNGITPNLVEEVSRALHDHELIKIKIPAGTADDRKACAAAIADATGSEVIHHIGRMVLLLRANPEPNPKLSNLARFVF
ncbi:RNA binding protein [Moraxella catarrhalis]|uniref:YhbY family RNA-binding protein n=1 Tax=Moraxella catarrhalis TaxID=480 RepID=UPI0007E39C81|nr:YhbY family RNA-binding protein [Moraxella catarrhalis]OAV15567.1 RNA binding protein [Moraxella catarrhalis]OAV15920.1 RNA binding protein [Moraxella catarrhalis]OAV16914.1 RNA binding protein [Moraxella catarrhalis]OAV20359.1 RNA binding protein [Moraxella catarrhalis]OAV33532.1 RNA binding protein [Moraxella catarrhalis]